MRFDNFATAVDRRRFAEAVPFYLDPASAGMPEPSGDTPVTYDPTVQFGPPAPEAGATSSSWWDALSTGASQIFTAAVQTGTAVASAALMRRLVATKGPPPPGYTYNSAGNLIPIPKAAGSSSLGGSMLPLLAVGAVVVGGAFMFARRK